MLGLALAYLRDRALTTALNVLLLALAVATLVILLLFSTQIGERFTRDAAKIDLVVGAKGSPLQLILSSIYQIDAPTGNIPLESVALLRRDPSVAQVVPLALGDQFRGFRIVGTEAGYLSLHDASLTRGRIWQAAGEVVIGAEVARRTGMTLGQRFVGSHGLAAEGGGAEHEERPFMAVGVLKPTGSVIDRLILTSVESVWDAHGIGHQEGHEESHEVDEHGAAPHADAHEKEEAPRRAGFLAPETHVEPEVTALLVRYRNALGAVRVPGMVNRQTEMQAAVPAIETARLLSLLGVGIDGARVFAWLIAATGGLSIFIALLTAASAREGDLALLRVMGATRGAVFGTILMEGVMTAAAGALAGVAAAHLALAAARGSFEQLGELGIDPWRVLPGELTLVLLVIGIGALAALIPALRVFGTDLARTLARAT
jgi:putative ABC transport system permease protein